MISWFRRLFCSHKYKIDKVICTGVACSWSFRPTRKYTHVMRCEKCGKTKHRTGMIHLGESISDEEARKLWKEHKQ